MEIRFKYNRGLSGNERGKFVVLKTYMNDISGSIVGWLCCSARG